MNNFLKDVLVVVIYACMGLFMAFFFAFAGAALTSPPGLALLGLISFAWILGSWK